MSKFEKKFGKYAIPNLTLVLIMCYVAGYIIQLMGAAGAMGLAVAMVNPVVAVAGGWLAKILKEKE